jgi:peptidoglycan/LPS O-acetylase OafA/YrhL
MPTNKIAELESIRGLAALLIVFVHIPYQVFPFDSGIVRNGYLMVELFFVLSGFVIFNAYEGKINTPRALLRFQFLRFARLYPVHLLFLTVFLLIEGVKYYAVNKMGVASPNSMPFRENNLTAFIEQIFLVQAIGATGNTTTFNSPAWSISVEFYTYILFGVILLCVKRAHILIFALLSLGSLTLIITKNTHGFTYILQCFAGFFLGCLTAFFAKRSTLKLPSLIAFLLFMSIIVFLILKKDNDYDPVIFLLSALLIFTIVKSEGGLLKQMLNFKILTWLGTISYSVYMSHSAILWGMNNAIRLFVKRPEIIGVDGKSIPNLTLVETLGIYALILVLVLGVSHLTYHYVESYWREKSRQISF